MGPDGSFRLPAALRPLQRPMGQNDVGIVAWHMVLRTPECPEGRQVGQLLSNVQTASTASACSVLATTGATSCHCAQHCQLAPEAGQPPAPSAGQPAGLIVLWLCQTARFS